jgi:hypothetical protein
MRRSQETLLCILHWQKAQVPIRCDTEAVDLICAKEQRFEVEQIAANPFFRGLTSCTLR